MQEPTISNASQIPATSTLDVQGIERQLNELWMQNAGEIADSEDGAMLRARVLNLMIFMSSEDAVNDVENILMDLASVHPCRAILLVADIEGQDNDIEMSVSSRCQPGRGAGGLQLCCEQVTLRAAGQFIVELPSASVPLLVSDLPVFLWWRAKPDLYDQVWQSLSRASDRIIIDTAFCLDPHADFLALAQFLDQSHGNNRRDKRSHGLSDLNWSRLTPWRTLLAGFYDAPEHLEPLSQLTGVRIDYIPLKSNGNGISSRALLLAGWLGSRLGWRPSSGDSTQRNQQYYVEKDGREIVIQFRPTSHSAVGQGGISRVELTVDSDTHKNFVAMRAEDCRDFETREASETKTRTTNVVSSADKSESGLIVSELELLSHDRIYEEAVASVMELFPARTQDN